MPRNDRSDSLSVRAGDDPRRPMKGMQQETELELRQAEAGQSGGVEHRRRDEREGEPGRRAAEQAPRRERRAGGAAEEQHPPRRSRK